MVLAEGLGGEGAKQFSVKKQKTKAVALCMAGGLKGLINLSLYIEDCKDEKTYYLPGRILKNMKKPL